MKGGAEAGRMTISGEHEPADLRLALPALGAWLAAVMTLTSSPVRALTAAAAALLAAAVLAGLALLLPRLSSLPVPFRARRLATRRPTASREMFTRRRGAAVAALLCASASAASVGLRLIAVRESPLRDLAAEGADAVVELVVTGEPKVLPPEVHGEGVRRYVLVRARTELVRTGGVHVAVRSPLLVVAAGHEWESLLPSQRLTVRGELDLPRHDELLSAVMFPRGPPELTGDVATIQRVAGDIRAGLRRAVRPLPPAEQGLLPGLVVGDTSRMPQRLVEEFRATGLAHLTAVSGANVTLILVAVLTVARWLGCGPRVAPLIAGVGVLGFAVLARPSPSVLRATAMGLITVFALATGRQRQALPALFAAVLGLLLVDPGLARSYGFALSVLATAGLIVLVPGWSQQLARYVPRGLAEALAVPAAAQVVCLPVVVMLAGEISVVAIPANLVAAPAVAPATVCGVLAAIVAPVCMPLAQVFAALGGIAAGWIVRVAHVGAAVPFGTIPWRHGLLGGFAALVGVLIVVLVRGKARRLLAACLACALIAAVTLRTVAPAWPPRGWLVVACDVGQGDALVLSAGHGAAVVVDAGPNPARVHQCLTRLRVRRVPLLILTHRHADHVAGLPGVLRGRDVGIVLQPPPARRGPLFGPGVAAFPVNQWLRAAEVTVRTAVPGRHVRVGTLRLRILGPQGRMRGSETGLVIDDSAAINNASIVVRAWWPGRQEPSGGISVLLTGDIEPEAQRSLLGRTRLRADVLKVPHHGSPFQAATFLAAVDPRVALISVGENNDYGHPAPETLRLLRSLGARTYRTDQDGSVAVTFRDGRLAVVTRQER